MSNFVAASSYGESSMDDSFESDLLEFCHQFYDGNSYQVAPTFNTTPAVDTPVQVANSSSTSTRANESHIDKSLQDSQQRLIFLYHALNCEESNANPPRPCRISRKCQETVQLLRHVSNCLDPVNCSKSDCAYTHNLMEHFSSCTTPTCLLCSPLNETIRRKKSRLSSTINRRVQATSSPLPSPTFSHKVSGNVPQAPFASQQGNETIVMTPSMLTPQQLQSSPMYASGSRDYYPRDTHTYVYAQQTQQGFVHPVLHTYLAQVAQHASSELASIPTTEHQVGDNSLTNFYDEYY